MRKYKYNIVLFLICIAWCGSVLASGRFSLEEPFIYCGLMLIITANLWGKISGRHEVEEEFKQLLTDIIDGKIDGISVEYEKQDDSTK